MTRLQIIIIIKAMVLHQYCTDSEKIFPINNNNVDINLHIRKGFPGHKKMATY